MNKIARISPKQTALLVIDVQRAIFTRPNPVYNAYKIIEVINALVDRAQLYGATVVYIQHSNKTILQKGSDGWQLHPEIKPGPRDLTIHKEQGNSFIGTTLQGDMEARGIENLLITGLVSNQCVRATALGGLELGYDVFLVQGGHSNVDKNPEALIERTEQGLEEAGVYLVTPGQIDFN